MRRQFYVGNTRFRGSHRIYVSHDDAILRRLALPDTGRELATEFIERSRLNVAVRIAPRPIQRLRSELRQAWLTFTEHRESQRERQGEKV